ncbi:MAG: membrane-bound lytic murein transglycosylase MltF [Gammaproteobacteria bacterium]|nr:membrane-bound lytic murein transglycosylase MltF [Gammaproteobacteria bacterium]
MADKCDGFLNSVSTMRVIGAFIAAAIALVVVLNACTPQRTLLGQVLASGELRVLTRNAGTTYYEGPHGPAGLEYQLLKRFAKHLGVKLVITVPDNLNDILEDISKGNADIAAAGLTVTKEREKSVRFSPAYQTITQELVYNVNKTRPKNLDDLDDGTLEVVAQSSHAERLQELKSEHQDLSWVENQNADSTELLSLVSEGLIDYTVADSNEVAINRRFYPELKVAFEISKPQELAWAFPKTQDTSLYDAASKFMTELKESGELDRILKSNYQHASNFDYTGTNSFLGQIHNRLPAYRNYFEEAAKAYNLDWRLLAALSYQESHWRPHAVSYTGVRGIMMLTQATAKHLGVEERTDARESILGGARYLRYLIDKLPDDIKEPDRTWIAVAAYNVGYGHVEDARAITDTLGNNPHKWIDIKASLPYLAKRKWYKQTEHGYARGWEPVRYVENIRSYYDILVWQLGKEQPYMYRLRPILALSSSAL